MKKIISVLLVVVLVILASVSVSAATVKKGDLNRDGKVTAMDARTALKKAAGTESTTSDDLKIADFNNNGRITAYDARQILKIAAGLVDETPNVNIGGGNGDANIPWDEL